MTAEHALVRLAAVAADAVVAALVRAGVDAAVAEAPAVLEDPAAAALPVPVPGLATAVAFGGAMTASNVLVLPAPVAAALGAGSGAAGAVDERSAAGAVAGEALAAAAAATGTLLGARVDAGEAELRTLAAPADAVALLDTGAAGVVLTALDIGGGRAQLLQSLPHASVVRAMGTFEALAAEVPQPPAAAPCGVAAAGLGGAVLATKLRVWAEVGRARLPAGRVVSLPAGAVVELDRLAEDPVDLYVNGHRYATGRLVVDDSGGWAVRIEQLLVRPSAG